MKDIAQERNFHAHIVCERQFDAWLEDPVGPSGAVNFITTNEEYVRACLSEVSRESCRLEHYNHGL